MKLRRGLSIRLTRGPHCAGARPAWLLFNWLPRAATTRDTTLSLVA